MTAVEAKGPFLGIRHLQALLIFLNIVVVYIGRLNVSVAVVAMTDSATTNPDFPEYDWTEKEISYILSSFYWGYVLTQFPGGYFARRFGVKITMLISTLGSAILSLITPLCIPWGGWQIFCGIRIVQGLFQGTLFPCIHEHLAKWSPLHERNRLGALSHTGIECGTVLAMSISGIIAASALGWPGISYISGGLNLLWCALWFIFAANNAPESKFITNEEKKYIESSLARPDDFHQKKIPVPWRAILTSVPFYALLTARCAEAWGFSTIQTKIPSYLHGVLDMSITSNALYSSLPYLTMWVLSYCYLIAADLLLSKKILTLTAVRKSINSIAFWVPAAALIGVGFLDQEHKSLAIALMCICVGVNGGATIGSSLNTIDLSPNHAGVLMGIVNCIANCVPILTPLVAGFIVTDTSDRTQWQIVFIIAAVIFFVGNTVYIIWGSAVAQPWNDPNFLLSKDVDEGVIAKKEPKRLSFVLPEDVSNDDRKGDFEKKEVRKLSLVPSYDEYPKDSSEKSNNT